MSDNSVRKSATEAEIDAALQSITDVAPSPELHTKVMQQLKASRLRSQTSEDGQAGVRTPKVRWSLEWRVALAAAAVLVIAASIWFALRPAPGGLQIATIRTPARDVTLPSGEPRAGVVDRREATAPESHAPGGETTPARGSHPATAVTGRAARRAAGRWPAAGVEVGQHAAVVQDFAIPALLPPAPVQVAPLAVDEISVERIDIPPLQIDPVEGNPSKQRGR